MTRVEQSAARKLCPTVCCRKTISPLANTAATPALAKALDAETEVLAGATLLSTNAPLMQRYIDTYGVSIDAFNNFALNAQRNARTNPYALFHALVRRCARVRWRGGAAHAQ